MAGEDDARKTKTSGYNKLSIHANYGADNPTSKKDVSIGRDVSMLEHIV